MKKVVIKDLVGSSYHSIKLFDGANYGNPDKHQFAMIEFRFEKDVFNVLVQNPKRVMRVAQMNLEVFRNLFKGIL